MSIKTALCTIAFREKLLEVALDAAARLGFDGVEIWGREPHISETFDENRVRTAERMARSRGLAIPVFGSYFRLGATRSQGDGKVQLQDTLHIARCLRTPIVRIWASDVPSAEADDRLWKRVVREGREACDRAADLNITIVAEMHDNTLCDTGASACRLVELIGRDNFRLNFQVAAYDHGESAVDRLQQVLPYVAHVHAQNYYRLATAERQAQRAPLAAGVWDYPTLVHMLREAGYEGYIAIEFPAREGDGKLQSLAEDLQYLRSLL